MQYTVIFLAILFSLYFILECHYGEELKKYKTRIRKGFYILWFFAFSIIYSSIDIERVKKLDHLENFKVFENKIAIPEEYIMSISLFIAFMLLGLVIDMFFISGSFSNIKSINKDGIEFFEDTKTNAMNTQDRIVKLYEKKIEAEHKILQEIEAYSELRNILFNYMIRNIDEFDPILELNRIIEKYINLQEAEIDSYVFEKDELNDIKRKFNMNMLEFSQMKRDILVNKSGFINNKQTILCFTFKYSVIGENEEVIIVLNSKEPLLIREQYIVLNILQKFQELYFKSMDEVMQVQNEMLNQTLQETAPSSET